MMKIPETQSGRERWFKKLGIMGTTDVADYLGWPKTKVATYNNRGGMLPPPVGEVGGRPVWLRIQIEEAEENIRARERPRKNSQKIEDE